MSDVTVTKRFQFEAAHTLPKHPGKCKQMHGHSYKLEVTVGQRIKDKSWHDRGYYIDFGELKQLVEKTVVEPFDHQYLNDLIDRTPSAENLALLIKKMLDIELGKRRLQLVRLRLYETEDCYVEVST